jgi:hypothetical protein
LRKQETMIKCMKRPFKCENDHSMNNSKKQKNKANQNRQENQKYHLFLKPMTIIEVIYVQEKLKPIDDKLKNSRKAKFHTSEQKWKCKEYF